MLSTQHIGTDITEQGRDPKAIHITTRSVLDMMQVMAGGVQVPQSDVARGIVPPAEWFPVGPDGALRFTIRSGNEQPKDRLAIRHRASWFWIADSDVVSKSAFLSLLTHFNVRAGAAADPRTQPVLTLPIGQ